MLYTRNFLPAVEHLGGPVYWLTYIRRPYSVELLQFTEEMQSRIFYRVTGQSSIKLQKSAHSLESLKETTSKPSDGIIAGSSSEVWIISQEQWDAIVAEDRA